VIALQVKDMARTVKHLSLHRIAGTELRVVADVEDGVLPIVEIEEAVIRKYVRQQPWPHRSVNLFVLEDLQPLVRQLEQQQPKGRRRACPERSRREADSLQPAATGDMPVVNVYDLADLASCNVFVNRQVMVREGYWDDSLAVQGLLAHEHAHPLAENVTTRASRELALQVALEGPALTGCSLELKDRLQRLLVGLATKLCLCAPREILANQMTIASGFGDALLYLDRRNVTNASRSVQGRDELLQQLQQQVSQGNLTPTGSELVLLVGDLNSYLDLALEIAPFYRAGRESDARELEAILEKDVFSRLEPKVAQVYAALRDQYVALDINLALAPLRTWSAGILDLLAQALVAKGLPLPYRLGTPDR
jgi:hypothetical protein